MVFQLQHWPDRCLPDRGGYQVGHLVSDFLNPMRRGFNHSQSFLGTVACKGRIVKKKFNISEYRHKRIVDFVIKGTGHGRDNFQLFGLAGFGFQPPIL
jgi:hypothetical protein